MLEDYGGIILLLAIVALVMYFFLKKPWQQQQREPEERTKEMRVGDKVITAGGIYGQIESLGDDTVILEIESGARMKVSKASILRKQGDGVNGGGIF